MCNNKFSWHNPERTFHRATQNFTSPKVVITARATDGRPYGLVDFHLIESCHNGFAYCVGGTSSVAYRRHLPLEGKALVRIEIPPT